MRAYLILAHKSPIQLLRVVTRLSDTQSHFFIHIDASVDDQLFQSSFVSFDNVYFVKRAESGWGSMGLIYATNHLLKAAMSHEAKFGHVILLSAQDYPIKTNAEISEFLTTYPESSFVEYFKIPNHEKWKPNGGLYRVNKYYLGLETHNKYAAKALNLLARFIPALKRKLYLGMEPYAGSGWWILSRKAAEYVITFSDEHPGYFEFHKHTFAPDEVFFQSILLYGQKKNAVGELINDNKRFIKWKNMSSSHPEIITTTSLTELENSTALFARKFDMLVDKNVFDEIDQRLLKFAESKLSDHEYNLSVNEEG